MRKFPAHMNYTVTQMSAEGFEPGTVRLRTKRDTTGPSRTISSTAAVSQISPHPRSTTLSTPQNSHMVVVVSIGGGGVTMVISVDTLTLSSPGAAPRHAAASVDDAMVT